MIGSGRGDIRRATRSFVFRPCMGGTNTCVYSIVVEGPGDNTHLFCFRPTGQHVFLRQASTTYFSRTIPHFQVVFIW